jgi:hypothetical protein
VIVLLWLSSVVCFVLLSAVGGPLTIPASGLYVAPCSREAALWAVRAYHYSRTLPSATALLYGVWEDGTFIGCVIVSRGACPNIGQPFGLSQDRIAEVTRIALCPGHVAPVSQVLAVVVRLLRRSNPGLELLISYADQRQQHHGGVYQSSNWVYLGETQREALLWVNGRETHARTISSRYGTRDLQWLRENVDPHAARIDCPPKHKYALGLTPAMRKRLSQVAQPYPKKATEAQVSGARGAADWGATPSTPGCGDHQRGDSAMRSGRSTSSEVAHG